MLPFRERLTVEHQGRGRVRRDPRVQRGKAPQTAHRWFDPGRKTRPLGRPRRPGGSPRPAARESRCLRCGIDPERAWRELEAFYHGRRPRVNPEAPHPVILTETGQTGWYPITVSADIPR